MKVAAIIQARMGSTRLPNKVLLPINEKPVLWHINHRLKFCKNIDKIIIATSTNKLDDAVEEFAKKENILCFRGSEEDLLDRLYQTCKKFDIDHFVRVTGDCPFVDPNLVDEMIDIYFKNKEDYDLFSNVHPPTFPDGLDLEIIPFKVLEETHNKLTNNFDREWFTTYLFEKAGYKCYNHKNNQDLSKLRWTLDTKEDYEFFKVVFKELFKENEVFLKNNILDFLDKNPDVAKINSDFKRNYAYFDELNKKNKVLLVGCGNIGRKHIQNLNNFKGDVVVCDKDEKTLEKIKKQFPNIKTYLNFEQALITEKPDFTIINTPNDSHLSLARKAVHFSNKIFIEKPISNNLEGVDEFLEQAKERNVDVVVGFNMRFNKTLQKIKEIIKNNQLGKIFSVKVNFSSYLPDRHPGRSYEEDYVCKEEFGGGVIFDVSHELDYLVWLFGKPKELFCFAEKRSDLKMNTEDSADILLKFNEFCVANIHLDFLRRPYTRTCEIIGEKATLFADLAKDFDKTGRFEKGEIRIFHPDKKDWEVINIEQDHNDTYVQLLSDFLSPTNQKNSVVSDGVNAKNILTLALAAKESAKSGRKIVFDWKTVDNVQKSDELFKKAEELIPGQSQTLSKGHTQFVKGVCPVFLKRGKGSHVWDVDDKEYIDFALALGPVTLGYNYEKTDNAIINQLKNGISFSLPHPLEVELSEKIVELVPCAEMVRFAKNGGDSTTGAIKVARAYTGRDKVAYCGYHGGSTNWYGVTTILNKGIPKILKDLIFKFEYNKIDTLEKIFSEHKDQIAAVIMGPVIYDEPKDDFLQKVKELTHKNNAVLIFDEMVTGFRVDIGGAQKYYNVIPDLATFGKGVANGMPLSILAGKKEIMKECENIFFSMTFGGETLSLAAASAAIDEFKEKNVIEHFWKQGSKLKNGYNDLAKKYNLDKYTKCSGLPVHNQFEFKNEKDEVWYELKSLFLQETVKRGILFSGVNNICFSHSDEDIDKALESIEQAFIIIKKAIEEDNIKDKLEGIPVQPIFRSI